MDKKMLYQYKSIKLEIKRLQDRIKQLQLDASAPSIQRMTGMPFYHDMDYDKFSEYMSRKQELIDALSEKMTKLMEEEKSIENAIDGLSSVQRRLMRYRYIDGLEWNDICTEMNYGWAQIHRIHGAALQALKDID